MRSGINEVSPRRAAVFANGSAGFSRAPRRGFLQEMMTAQAVKLAIIDAAFAAMLGVRA